MPPRSRGTLNVATGNATSFLEVARTLVSIVKQDVEIETTPRQSPITHRHFDISATIKAFPAFKPVSLEEGLAQTYLDMSRAQAAGGDDAVQPVLTDSLTGKRRLVSRERFVQIAGNICYRWSFQELLRPIVRFQERLDFLPQVSVIPASFVKEPVSLGRRPLRRFGEQLFSPL